MLYRHRRVDHLGGDSCRPPEKRSTLASVRDTETLRAFGDEVRNRNAWISRAPYPLEYDPLLETTPQSQGNTF